MFFGLYPALVQWNNPFEQADVPEREGIDLQQTIVDDIKSRVDGFVCWVVLRPS